jgi:hypothetical protein
MKNGDVCTSDWKTPEGNDRRKCLKHRAWMRKGKCELCLREQDMKRQEVERQKRFDN